ncbi:MAG TPA: hypothetical protein VE931_08005 [Pyrinomonadaceae bacterium]|nr:hypothetical protein [Pyrinomonadaceae bacterium]
MISSRSVAELPGIDDVKRISQSIATLDAIMTDEWEYRYFSFDANWGDGEMLATMRDGSGDSYLILFNSFGAIIKGYGHESEMAAYTIDSGKVWRGVLDEVPPEFETVLTDPAFVAEETSFCIWRKYSDSSWQTGKIDFPDSEFVDGSEDLLFMLDGNPNTYHQWANEYYEVSIPLDAVKEVYEHKPLTQQLISRLNSKRRFEDLESDLDQIRYP